MASDPSSTTMGPSRQIIRFAEFTFDPDTRQLTKQGKALHLSPKAFDLLSILIRNRPRAMPKAELHAELWPDSFVSDSNLPGLVKEIRRAVGPDAPATVVRTVHGYGYAFAATAEDDVAGGPAQTQQGATYWLVGERETRLPAGQTILGRDPDATVWFDRSGVSRRHARITTGDTGAILEDLGSTNGTWVRGHRVASPTPLQDGDDIRLGPVQLTFRIRTIAGPTEVS